MDCMRFPVWLPHCCKFPWKSMKSRVLTFGPYNQHFLAAAYIYLTVKSCNQKIGTMTGFPLSARVLEDLVRGCLLRCIQEVHSRVFQLSKYNKHFPFLWQRDFFMTATLLQCWPIFPCPTDQITLRLFPFYFCNIPIFYETWTYPS